MNRDPQQGLGKIRSTRQDIVQEKEEYMQTPKTMLEFY